MTTSKLMKHWGLQFVSAGMRCVRDQADLSPELSEQQRHDRIASGQ
jgi:hypothetical protein